MMKIFETIKRKVTIDYSNCVIKSLLLFLTKYFSRDEIKKNTMTVLGTSTWGKRRVNTSLVGKLDGSGVL